MIKSFEIMAGETKLVRTVSTVGVMIKNENGVLYSVADDVLNHTHTYEETDIPTSDIATEADKDAALRRFGVEV